MEGYYSAPGINVIIPFAAKHEGCGTEIVVKPEILVNVYGSWPIGTDADKMKEDIAEAIKRNIPRQEREARREMPLSILMPLSVLVFDWMKVAHDISKDPMPAMRVIWKKLEPILNKLSRAMAEKSPFKQNSIWYLDTYLYNRVIVESINKREGVFTFKPGLSYGAFLLESLTFPLKVEEMEFKDVVDWALAHDGKAYVPPSGEVFGGMFRR